MSCSQLGVRGDGGINRKCVGEVELSPRKTKQQEQQELANTEDQELVTHEDLYASFFLTFRKHATQNDFEKLSKSILEIASTDHFSSLASSSSPSLTGMNDLSFPTTSEYPPPASSSFSSCKYNILSIGSGSGVMDVHLLKCLTPHLIAHEITSVEYCAVECNTVLFNQFAENVTALESPFEIQLSQCTESVETFLSQGQLHPLQQYDMILVSHFLYYAKDRKRTIEILLRSLKSTGRIIILHHGPGGINQLQKLIGKQFNPNIHKLTCNCYDVQELLKSVSHSICQPIEFSMILTEGFVNVTKCFEPRDAEGRKLMSFFVESNLMDMKQEEVQPLVDYLQAVCIQRVEYAQEQWYLFHPTACIIVNHKQ